MKILFVINNYYITGNGLSASARRTVIALKDAGQDVRILSGCGELGLFVSMHAGLDVGIPGGEQAVPRKTLRAIRQAGPVTLVLAHMGGWTNWDEVPYLLADTGVYLDTSFSSESIEPLDDGYWDDKDTKMMDADQYMEIIRAFGPERILFGSDSPWTDQKRSRKFIEKLPLSGDELRLILGGSAERILDILTPLKVL